MLQARGSVLVNKMSDGIDISTPVLVGATHIRIKASCGARTCSDGDINAGATPHHDPTSAHTLSKAAPLAHVYLQQPPTQFAVQESLSAVMYDDSNRIVLIAAQGKVFVYPISSPRIPAAAPSVIDVTSGPVLAARLSLDGQTLAMLRSHTEVEFAPRIARTNVMPFVYRLSRMQEKILGFFWTTVPGLDFAIITSGGLETFVVSMRESRLRPVGSRKKTPVSWYVYTHETRLVLLASGPQCTHLTGFQFTTGGIIKLPKFELPFQVPACASVRGTDTAELAAGMPRPALECEDVQLLTLYGRLFLVHIDRNMGELVLFRFYRDALLKQHTFKLYSPCVGISVVDNVLLVHAVSSGVVLVLDILASTTEGGHPVAAPLPLGIGAVAAGPGPGFSAGVAVSPAEVYGSGWRFILPDVVLDSAHGVVWRLQLDLRAVSESSSDRLSLLAFLQRRSQTPWSVSGAVGVISSGELPSSRTGSTVQIPPLDSPKALSIGLLHTMLTERESVGRLAPVFDLLCLSYAQARSHMQHTKHVKGSALQLPSQAGAVTDAGVRDTAMLPAASSAVSPPEVYALVFAPFADGFTVDREYLRAAVAEYVRAAYVARIAVPRETRALLLDLLCTTGVAHQLPQWAPVLVAAEGDDTWGENVSAAEALRRTGVLGTGGCSAISAYSLLRDLERCGRAHGRAVRRLLAEGSILAALRYVQRHHVETVPPAVFMESAAAVRSRDPVIYSAVFRFCAEYVPGFQAMPDYANYIAMLQQQNPLSSPTQQHW